MMKEQYVARVRHKLIRFYLWYDRLPRRVAVLEETKVRVLHDHFLHQFVPARVDGDIAAERFAPD